MRWIAFVILAGLFLTLQSTWGVTLSFHGWRADWLLALVVFISMHARGVDAIAGAWALGFAADLMSIERVGLLALTYMLVSMLVVYAREYLFCDRSFTRFAVTLVLAGAVRAVWWSYAYWMYGAGPPSMMGWIGRVSGEALYTAIWAVICMGILDPFRSWLGFPQPKYTHQGLRKMVADHV